MSPKIGGILKGWRIENGQIVGEIHGDKRFVDGEKIITSGIRSLVATTNNTIYLLETPNKEEL